VTELEVKPFRVAIADADLDELKLRLARAAPDLLVGDLRDFFRPLRP
jgi:hypothetical protein